MASLGKYCSLHLNNKKRTPSTNPNVTTFTIPAQCSSPLKIIKVVINGATKDIGRAAIAAVSKARGKELSSTIDNRLAGQDAGESKATGVVANFTNPSTVYNNVKQVDVPSLDAIQIADNLSNLGQLYNGEDISTDAPGRGLILGEDGIRVHNLVLPGLPSSTIVHFSGPGEVYSLRHDITNVQSLMPGLILAIRKVVRLKNLIYDLEKFL